MKRAVQLFLVFVAAFLSMATSRQMPPPQTPRPEPVMVVEEPAPEPVVVVTEPVVLVEPAPPPPVIVVQPAPSRFASPP